MLKVGVTGGIGSGKSIICQIFKALKVPVYNADQRAKVLVETDVNIKSRIIEVFGERSYTGSTYNRKYIAKRVFSNKKLLEKLNGIVHPVVADDFSNWIKKLKVPYVIEEAAILFESGANEKMDKIIVVEAPEELRIKRIKTRDGLKEDEIKFRVQNQWSTDKLAALADWVINNNDKMLVLPQILHIHNILIKNSEN